MRRFTKLEGARLLATTTNHEAERPVEGARAAKEGRGRVQGLWGERESACEKTEGEERGMCVSER